MKLKGRHLEVLGWFARKPAMDLLDYRAFVSCLDPKLVTLNELVESGFIHRDIYMGEDCYFATYAGLNAVSSYLVSPQKLIEGAKIQSLHWPTPWPFHRGILSDKTEEGSPSEVYFYVKEFDDQTLTWKGVCRVAEKELRVYYVHE